MPRILKKDLIKAANFIPNILENYANVLIAMGKIEKTIGPVSKLGEKLGKVDLSKMVKKFEKDPKFSARIGAIVTRAMYISPKIEKFTELSADEKINIGKSVKEIAKLAKEIVKEFGKKV